MSYSPLERTYLKTATAVRGRTRALGAERPFYRLHRLRVTTITDVAPLVRRLTLAGDSLRSWTPVGPDEYFGLVMAPAGRALVLPEGQRLNLRTELAAMPERIRPELRWYTVRSRRPDAGEVDVDMVLHDSGPGADFLRRVAVGDEVGFREGTASWTPPSEHAEQLLIADETALPALAAISDHVRATAVASRIRALVEVPTPDHACPFDPAFEVTWLLRGEQRPGHRVLSTMESAVLPPLGNAWVCGEQALAAGGRRHLVRARHVPRTEVAFSGYWRLGAARA